MKNWEQTKNYTSFLKLKFVQNWKKRILLKSLNTWFTFYIYSLRLVLIINDSFLDYLVILDWFMSHLSSLKPSGHVDTSWFDLSRRSIRWFYLNCGIRGREGKTWWNNRLEAVSIKWKSLKCSSHTFLNCVCYVLFGFC